MIPPALKAWLMLGVLVLAAAGGWFINGWRLHGTIETLNAIHARETEQAATAAKTELARAQAQRDVLAATFAGVDSTGLAKLKEDANETERLRTCLRAGTCGVRIKATCPANPASLSASAAGSSVDSGAGAVLTGPAESDYLALRGGIASATRKLDACQTALGCTTGQRGCPTQ